MKFKDLPIGTKFKANNRQGLFVKTSGNTALNKFGCEQWFAVADCGEGFLYSQKMEVTLA